MALVRSIITDALVELGINTPGTTPAAGPMATGLLRIQNMIDAAAANRLTLSMQLRTTFVLTSGTSSVQVGTGQTVNIVAPLWVNHLKYLVPGSSPGVEVPIGQMDEDAFAALSIKDLPSALPIQSFYQTNLSDAFGTLFFWPKVTANVSIVLYTPQAIEVPATLDTDLIGPAGYQDWFMYGLAERLITPLGVNPADVPLLPGLAARAWTNMTRPNIKPGVLSVDAALVGGGSGYNILSDQMQGSR
jgi:hypothetical protein